ncbi:MAG: hypothetical protein H7318_19830 [Oligoflexus sp.]|nr:hypothetical protein [Oligoflexus sp.]
MPKGKVFSADKKGDKANPMAQEMSKMQRCASKNIVIFGTLLGLASTCKPSMISPKVPNVLTEDSVPDTCTAKSKDPAYTMNRVPKPTSTPGPKVPVPTSTPPLRKGCLHYKEVGLPKIYNCSSNEDKAAVVKLVQRAKDGLRFPAIEGPREEDTMFVGNFYMA